MQSLSRYAGQPIPAWLEFERARPLVLVVRRFEVFGKLDWNPYSRRWYEQLECGHQLWVLTPNQGGTYAKRRRCKGCAEICLSLKRSCSTTLPSQLSRSERPWTKQRCAS